MLKVQEIREIIRLVDQSSITQFEYESDGSVIKIKKEAAQVVSETKEDPVLQQQVQHTSNVEKQGQVQEEVPVQQGEHETTTDADNNIEEIVAPMVGTFYRKPSPESEPYVQIGDRVEEDSIVCIVEAMKLFNEIEAEVSGEIVEVLVGDGELVEYGQPLFKVKTK